MQNKSFLMGELHFLFSLFLGVGGDGGMVGVELLHASWILSAGNSFGKAPVSLRLSNRLN